jgi:hypothetical protein
MRTMVTVSFSLITAALLLAGCSTGSVYRKSFLGGLAPDEAIAIIADGDARAEERKLAACAGRELKGNRWASRIVAPHEFRRLALTNPSQQPRSPDDWAELARDPLFRERIASLNLRYLIVLDERHSKSSSQWDYVISAKCCGALIFAHWDVISEMSAAIVDLRKAEHLGAIEANSRGKSSVGALVFFVIPLPFGKPSFPEGVACRKLGEGVAEALLGNKSSQTRD